MQYFDKNGKEIKAGMKIIMEDGSLEMVYDTMDSEGNPNLGINASNEAFLAAHPNWAREYYSLSNFNVNGIEVCPSEEEIYAELKSLESVIQEMELAMDYSEVIFIEYFIRYEAAIDRRTKLIKILDAEYSDRGGYHLYFRDTVNSYRNAADLFKDGSGVDVRGEGGYVVAPGSVHNNGNLYSWESALPLVPIQEFPPYFQALLNKAPEEETSTQNAETVQLVAEIPEGQRTSSLFKLLSSLQSKGLSDEAIRAAIHVENEEKCKPPLTDAELEAEIFPALKRYQKGTSPYTFDREFDNNIFSLVTQLVELRPEQNKRYGWNDAGNGNLFSDLSEGVARYVPERKRWYYFDGKRWQPDTDSVRTKEYCKTVANALMIYATQRMDEGKQREEYIKYVSKWTQYRFRETILKDAATVAPVNISDFDSDTFLFNCENGTINLKNGEFHDHFSGDNITKLANVTYSPKAHSERWEKFIAEITCGDAELARYIQKAMG